MRWILFFILCLVGLNTYQLYRHMEFMSAMQGFVIRDDKVEPSDDSKLFPTLEYKIKPIVENNSETMSEMAYVFENLIENTNIMMRFNHYLDKHDPSVEIVPLCPECTKAEDQLLPIEEGRQEELPSTFGQITQDSYEIKMTVERIKNSLHNQKIKLKHTLDQLKELK